MEDNHSASNATKPSGSKRSFEDDENSISNSKKCCICTKGDEEGVAAAAMIVSLKESLQNCEDKLASCQSELESAKTEIDKWNSAFKKESFVPARKSPEPGFVIDYIQTLRSSEKSLKEELEIAQMKLAIRDLKSQLKPESMKTDEDPEQQGSTHAGPSRIAYLENELRAANMEIAQLREVQGVRVDALEEAQATQAKEFELLKNMLAVALQKSQSLVLTAALENVDVHK
ncbi:unnamed protein product [Eruca vesicaria subsp. sativa]|uniref:FKBP12-interacting protein of 37 kDa n=1 Tax=Eruca vesicaria subsp. sativa TaxID=29727 RepID=A0ABC8KL87_ERUVS|nr:unnamed protein product [Eruca vesicaria subsp. sativa]